MRSKELKVSPLSEYFVYTPSALALKLYLYPLFIGNFIYEPDYLIKRNNYDSFLIMYITKGKINIMSCGNTFSAKAGDFVLLDCYQPHQYGSKDPWETLWLHFDGPLARDYYQEIISHYNSICLTPDNPEQIRHTMSMLLSLFQNGSPIIESAVSGFITNILNGLMISSSEREQSSTLSKVVTDSVTFIREHFSEQISLEEVAARAHLSLYYFTRVFSRETGFTPHQYLINIRISTAKYMLKSSELSIKEIGFSTGFNSETSFCSTFKKWVGMTPSKYRSDVSSQE